MSTQHSAWYGLLSPCSRLRPIDFLPSAFSILLAALLLFCAISRHLTS